MPRTHTELIDELTKRVDTLSLAVEAIRSGSLVEVDHLKESARTVQSLVRELEKFDRELAVRFASLDERCKALEKGTDRTWQLAPIIISAVAILVSLIVAFVKK